jgi:tetratricopeptide (TPR) repeat protein
MASRIWVRAIATAAAIGLMIPAAAIGQTKGGTPAPATGSSGSTTGSTGTTSPNPGRTTTPATTNPNNTPSSGNLPQPIFISGRVMTEDGTPPPDPVTMETVCNGSPHAEGYSDSRGYFAIELGARNAVIQDASEFTTRDNWNRLGNTSTSAGTGSLGSSQTQERKYMGCDLQAKLSGYRSQTVPLSGRRPMDDPNVGTILLHRVGPSEEGNTVSAVSLAAPKDAKKAYDKGLEALKKEKFEDAGKNFEKAVEAYPNFASAWYELGLLQAGQGKMDMARKYFDKSLECDPKFVKPYLQISILELQSSRWHGLADVTDKLVKLDPFDYPEAFFYNAVANFNLQNVDAAEKSALAAERLDTRHAIPKVSQLLALILTLKKDYAGAAEHFRTYLKFAPDAKDAAKVRSQLAEVEKITAASAGAKEPQER